MAGQQQGISLAKFATGGMVDDVDLTIQDAMFTQYDYDGKVDHEVLALGVQFVDDNGKEINQYYSAGELTFFVPSDDGSMAIPVADKQMLSDSCNAARLIMSLLEVGVPEDFLATGNVKSWVGMKLHMKQIAQPKRQGLIRGGAEGDKEKTVLLATQLIHMPGEGDSAPAPKKAPVGKSTTTTTAKVPGTQAGKPALGGKTAAATSKVKPNGSAGASTPAASDELSDTALEMLTEILVENDGVVVKKDLSKLAFQKAGERVQAKTLDAKDKTKVVQLIFQDAKLHEWAGNGAIQYDGSQVSMPE
jgi:hypothetical protein